MHERERRFEAQTLRLVRWNLACYLLLAITVAQSRVDASGWITNKKCTARARSAVAGACRRHDPKWLFDSRITWLY